MDMLGSVVVIVCRSPDAGGADATEAVEVPVVAGAEDAADPPVSCCPQAVKKPARVTAQTPKETLFNCISSWLRFEILWTPGATKVVLDTAVGRFADLLSIGNWGAGDRTEGHTCFVDVKTVHNDSLRYCRFASDRDSARRRINRMG